MLNKSNQQQQNQNDSGSEHEILNTEIRNCHHDELGFKPSIEQMNDINPLNDGDQSTNYLQIRFINEMKYDTSTKQGYNLNQYTQRLFNAATTFFKSFLLQKKRRSGKLRFPINIDYCQYYQVDQSYKTIDTDDAHLIIFATKENYTDIKIKQFIFAATCIHNNDGPLYAQMNFDNDELSTTNFSDYRFAIDLQSLVHQIFHILGFSSNIYQKWTNGQFDQDNMILNTARIQSTTKSYYNLDSLVGMQLEDTIQQGVFSSHWKQILLKGDIMNQYFEPQPNISISEFTASLIEDTNWYEIPIQKRDYIKSLQWGRNGGYSFLQKTTTCSDVNRKEFCGINKPQDVSFGFENEGYGTCEIKQYSQQCQLYNVRTIDYCWNPFNSKDLDNKNIYSTSQSFSWQSKVFESNYEKFNQSISSKNFRCFEYSCKKSQNGDWYSIEIEIDDGITQECQQNNENQTMNIDNASTDNKYWIKCPSSITQFCSQYQQCPEFCSQKGLCINGKCICLEKNNRMETILDGITNKCNIKDCENGYFDNKLQKCMDCQLNCAKCEYSRDLCTECAEDYYMDSNGLCRGQCTKGWYGDKNTKMCLRCSSNCSECSNNAMECTACFDSFIVQDNKCVKPTPKPDDGTNSGNNNNNNNNNNSFSNRNINMISFYIAIFVFILC